MVLTSPSAFFSSSAMALQVAHPVSATIASELISIFFTRDSFLFSGSIASYHLDWHFGNDVHGAASTFLFWWRPSGLRQLRRSRLAQPRSNNKSSAASLDRNSRAFSLLDR